jgi:SAM-dependent methyltransferase
MYNALAPYYRKYSREKAVYLEAIDQIVIRNIPANAHSLLDVGSGDGIRAAEIARQKNIKALVLSEPSSAMVDLCNKIPNCEVWHLSAEDLPKTDRRFDVITCLWNVLGHISNQEKRLIALKKMHDLINPEGVIFIDINNRYNAGSYGWGEIIKRIGYDTIFPHNNKVDAVYELKIEDKIITGRGHLFTPQEITNLLQRAGLQIKHRYIVDYKTGKSMSFVLCGQLLFEIGRALL